jgi:hypothetical protein
MKTGRSKIYVKKRHKVIIELTQAKARIFVKNKAQMRNLPMSKAFL